MTIHKSLQESEDYDGEFFGAHAIALVIASGGEKPLGGDISDIQTLKNLLTNMSEYGGGKTGSGSDSNSRWSYVPGNGQKNAKNCLQGMEREPDCECLAKMFQMMASALGFTTALAREITRLGHRVVTEAIPSFDGRVGDEEIDYRWCFGNHWVVDFQSHTFDPTYNLNYPTGQGSTANAGFGWWAQERQDSNLRHGSYYKHPTDDTQNIYVVPIGQNRPAKRAFSRFCGLYSRPAVTNKRGGYETFNRDEYGVKWSSKEKFNRWVQSFDSDRGGDMFGEMIGQSRD